MDFMKAIFFPGKPETKDDLDTTEVETLLKKAAESSDLPCWDDKLDQLVRQALESIPDEETEIQDDQLDQLNAAKGLPLPNKRSKNFEV